MRARTDSSAAEAATKRMLDALPNALGAIRVAGLEQLRLLQAQRLASAKRQLALRVVKAESSKADIAEAELRVKAREVAAAAAESIRDAAAVMPKRSSETEAIVFGRVTGRDGKPAADLVAMAVDESGGGLARMPTDKRGGFSLVVPPGQSFRLQISDKSGVLHSGDAMIVAVGETAFRSVLLARRDDTPPDIPKDGLVMPDLVGQHIDAAATFLKRIGLVIGEVKDVRTSEAADRVVLATRPEAGAAVKPGQRVDLDVAVNPGRPPERIERRETVVAGEADAAAARYIERLVAAAADDTLAGEMPIARLRLFAVLRSADVADDAALSKSLEGTAAEIRDRFETRTVEAARKLRTRLRAAAKKVADA
jgi:hypothetical protein